jgi:hypothetical protein
MSNKKKNTPGKMITLPGKTVESETAGPDEAGKASAEEDFNDSPESDSPESDEVTMDQNNTAKVYAHFSRQARKDDDLAKSTAAYRERLEANKRKG